MICQNCGAPLSDGDLFCVRCGVRQETETQRELSPDEKELDPRFQFLLVAAAGLLLYSAIVFICIWRDPVFILAANPILMYIPAAVMITALIIEGTTIFAQYVLNVHNQAAAITAAVLEVVSFLCFLLFSRPVIELFTSSGAVNYGKFLFPYIAIAGLIGTAIAFLLGFLTDKRSVKKNALIIGGAFAAAFILSLIRFSHNSLPVAVLMRSGLAVGFMHPFIVITPCFTKKVKGRVVTKKNRSSSTGYKFCPKCGASYNTGIRFCSDCGTELKAACGGNNGGVIAPNDSSSFGFALLSFLFPLVGFILWLAWHNLLPLKARSCGRGVLFGLFFVILAPILVLVILSI